MGDLYGNRDNLSADEYRRGRNRLAGRYMSDIGLPGDIQAVGAMEAGSASAHAAIAQANMPDPKIGLQQETNRLLASIEKELQVQNGEVLQ